MYYGLLKLGFTGSDFELRDDSDGKGAYIDEWRSDKPQPSAEAIKTAQDEYDTEYASLEYSRNRKEEYPTIEECVHAILDGELDDLQIKRQAIKDKYPKETS